MSSRALNSGVITLQTGKISRRRGAARAPPFSADAQLVPHTTATDGSGARTGSIQSGPDLRSATSSIDSSAGTQ